MSAPGRTQWRCRRGNKELDLLLIAFLQHPNGYAALAENDCVRFDAMLEEGDEIWQAWLLQHVTPLDPGDAHVVESIHRALAGSP